MVGVKSVQRPAWMTLENVTGVGGVALGCVLCAKVLSSIFLKILSKADSLGCAVSCVSYRVCVV